MAEEFRVLRPREFHSQLIKKGTRADGRNLEEFREIKLETDAIKTANSSSLVKLGNTSLVCGCTTKFIKGHKNKQSDDDSINIKVELPPICSSPTGYQTQHTAQLLTRTLKNILDETGCLDSHSLYLNDEESLWLLDVEVICLNYDGCLLDAALIAVLTALDTLKLKDPLGRVPEKAYSLKSLPVCSSFATLDNQYVCDPNLEEETVAESTFSITIVPSSKGDMCHINKIGGKSIDVNRLTSCIDAATRRALQVRNFMKQNLNKEKIISMNCT